MSQNHAAAAAASALEQQAKLAELREEWERRGLPALHARVGISAGMVRMLLSRPTNA